MKKTIYNILTALMLAIPAMFTSCSPETINGLDPNGRPQASDIDVTISVDQETNQVTFTLNNTGYIPVWKIYKGEDNITYSTRNGYNEIFTIAGTYQVEVQMSNRNGVCEGSKVYEFTLDNTILDWGIYIKRLTANASKEWQIASDEPGHLGCGESGSDGLGWYSAAPEEKAGTGLYENRFTFTDKGETKSGGYAFDPGEGGKMFINTGITSAPFGQYNTGDGKDYSAPVEPQETTFELQTSGNDLYLVFPQGTLLGYMPFQEAYDNPRFKINSIKESSLELTIDNGSIAWHLTYKPTVKEASPAEMLAGTSAEGKIWYWDQNNSGHLGCGESGSDGLGWWSAAPLDKEAVGLYTQSFTFAPDGTYTFNPGEKGLYVNNGSSHWPEENAAYNEGKPSPEDFLHPMDVQVSTWQLVEEGADTYLVFPEGTFLGYMAFDELYDNPRFKVTNLTESIIDLVIDNGTIAWHYRLASAGTGGDEPDVFDEGDTLAESEWKDGLVGTWTWEPTTYGHFGCGESVDNATNWWAADANNKAGFGLYDDLLTFNADGTYVFNPGPDGKIYVNTGVTDQTFTSLRPEGSQEDYDVPFEEQTATYTYSNGMITFPANTVVSYVAADQFYTNPVVKIVKMTENILEFNTASIDGISWHFRMKRVK